MILVRACVDLFCQPAGTVGFDTCLHCRFLQLFGKQPFTHGGYWMARFHMCASAWLKISRPRPGLGFGMACLHAFDSS